MNLELSSLLNKFASTPGQSYILDKVAEDLIMPKLIRLSPIELYTVYLTILAFPNRSTEHGRIILKRMLDLKMLDAEYMEKEFDIYNELPVWVQEIIGKGS